MYLHRSVFTIMEFLDAFETFLNSPMDKLVDSNSEEWMIISDYPKYAVSNLGNVKNIQTDLVMAQRMHKSGYRYINLCKNGKRTTFIVHRLVASAFVPNPDNKPCVDHIDCDKVNNAASNLRWVTPRENSMNSKKQDNCSSIFKGVYFRKDRHKYQASIRINGKKTGLGLFDSQEEAAIAYNKAALQHFGQFARINTIK